MDDYCSMYLGEPEPINSELLDLARSYYRQTEVFDRTVCTGPVTRDGIMPATSRQLAEINRYAAEVLRELKRKAEERGFNSVEFRDAMRIAERDGMTDAPQ